MAFDDLRERLLVGGVAPRHVRRYLAELTEHLDDLMAQQRQAGYDGEDALVRARARLGSDDELASAMLAQKQLRSWVARAPWAVFLFLPPVVAIVMELVLHGPLIGVGTYYGFLGRHAPLPPQWFQLLATSVVTIANVTVVPLAAALFATLAMRQRLKLIWPLATTVLLLVLFIHSDVRFLPNNKGHLMIGIGLLFPRQGWIVLTEHWRLAMVQYALSLLPVLWLWRRRLARV